jgi:hypothetical protein
MWGDPQGKKHFRSERKRGIYLAQATAQPQYITSFCQIQHYVSWSLMPQNSQEDKMFLKSKAGHSFTNEKKLLQCIITGLELPLASLLQAIQHQLLQNKPKHIMWW